MVIEIKVLPKLDNTVIEARLKELAKEYILNVIIDERLRKLEDYLFDNYRFEIDIREILIKIIESLKVDFIGNKVYLMLPKSRKIGEVSTDLLDKIITYGNSSIKGNSVIRDAISYALSEM